ncbi:MAG: ribonuclease J [Candidatus Paceibacteria bacterium]|jgi:ribonuclease J
MTERSTGAPSPKPDAGRTPQSNTARPHTNSAPSHHRKPGPGGPKSPSHSTERHSSGGGRKMQRRPMRRGAPRPLSRKPSTPLVIPPVGENVRIIPIGGVEQVGQNMTAIEVGNDIIVIDAGIEFKSDLTPGIDFIIPNTKYLQENKERIRGIFITHGHLDHIGAIPHLIEKIGYPPIYSREFGAVMIQKRQTEFPHLKKLDIKVLDGDETTVISKDLKVESFPISHTIPDSMGLVIHTHLGDIVFIEDVRVDNMEGVPTDEEVNQYKRFKDSNVLMLTMDSTSIEKKGWSLSEQVVTKNLEKIIRETKGRLFIGAFASQVERLAAIVSIADTLGKKIIIEGRSMKTNLDIARQLKILQSENIIPMSEAENYPPDRLIFLVTGSQGEEFAVLSRVANGVHKQLKFRDTDTILLSSSIVPGNATVVSRLKSKLFRTKAEIITYLDTDVHASGHGNREELSWIHSQINYKFFMPVHGEHYMLRMHAKLAETLGTPKENIVVPDNGSIIEISDGGNKIEILAAKAPSEVVTVDGFSVSELQEVVMRDRLLLSEAGIFVIVASINTRLGKLKKSPDIISRGFVYLRESQELLHEVRNLIKNTIEKNIQGKSQVDFENLKKVVSNEVSKYLFQKTAKEPLVIPVILGV